jgi:hypothetical protein
MADSFDYVVVVMTDIPSGFIRLESTSPFHELVGPFYERRDRATLIIGMPFRVRLCIQVNIVFSGKP